MNTASTYSPITVASRSSKLALIQVEEVFSSFPDVPFSILPIQSLGDKNKNISLITNKIQDFFTREIDFALLNHQADIAIHSAKDLPYPLHEDLEIIALTKASTQTDALVSRGNQKLLQLPTNAKIGTSSATRQRELLAMRNDFEIVSIRGTIEERIAQIETGKVDAVIVATCALERLGLQSLIAEILPFETHPLQGNLAIVARKNNTELKKLFAPIDIRQHHGKVTLAGFGPGNPDLLTIRTMKALQEAEVIFYDDLLNKDFLNQFNAENHYVGKRRNQHSKEQADINLLLYQSALKGKNTLRLKGGDPMIFAHGGEEIEYLQQRLIHVSVIPGITTALAASALSKIPLTHRDLSSSVTFISGHNVDKMALPSNGTIVLYMSANTIQQIAQKLISNNWKPSTPVLLMHNASSDHQKEDYTTLHKLATQSKTFETPLIIIIGNVVGLKNSLAENIAPPTFLVTGTNPDLYQKWGNIIHTPLIEISPLADYSELHNHIKNIESFDWLIFTSKYSIEYFFYHLRLLQKDSRALSTVKIASVGNMTTSELAKHGIVPDLQPANESSEALVALFEKENIQGQNILIPRSDIALSILPDGLKKLNNHVTTTVVYQNMMPENVQKIDLQTVDFVIFSSPSCVKNFHLMYQYFPNNIQYIVRGGQTRKQLESHSVEPSIIINQTDYEPHA